MERSEIVRAIQIQYSLEPHQAPTAEEGNRFLTDYEDRLNIVYEMFESNPERARQELSVIKQRLVSSGNTHSRPLICAGFTQLSITDPILEQALTMYSQGDTKGFSLRCDLAFALCDPIGTIIAAEESIRGNDGLEQIIDAGVALGLSMSDQAEVYTVSTESKRKYSDLLKKDPSGFELLDQKMEDASKQEYFINNPAILALGKYTVKLYKMLYPLTESLE